MNDRAALDLLLEHGPLSRTRLGELTGLSKPTASQLLARLERAGLVVATGVSEGGPGRGAQLYEINPIFAYVAALDVTSSHIVAAVADISGRVVGRSELRTRRGTGGHRAAARLGRSRAAMLEPGLEQADLHRLVIGTPGAFDPTTGRLRYARHLPGWHEPDLLAGSPRRSGCRSRGERREPRGGRRAGGRTGRGRRRLRAAVGGRGSRRCDRHRRAPARRSHRRRRRGRLPAAARHSPGPPRRAQQHRRLPGARRRQAGAGAGAVVGPAGRVATGRGRAGADDTRRRRQLLARARGTGRAGARLHGRRAGPRPDRAGRRGAERGRRDGSPTSCAPS